MGIRRNGNSASATALVITIFTPAFVHNEEAPIEIKSANLFIEETLRNLNTPWSAGYDMSPPLTKELDTKDHPFVRGHGNISEELNGED